MSSEKWIRKVPMFGFSNSMCVPIITNYESVGEIAKYSTELNVSLITGDYTKWCNSLLWFPIQFVRPESLDQEININGKPISGTQGAMITDVSLSMFMGATLISLDDNYFNYEPYTTCELYLPFYGLINLPLAEFKDKYLVVLLNIDIRTGQAMYIVGVSNSFPPYNGDFDSIYERKSATYYDCSEVRIFAQYVFQLGVQIPLGTANMAETYRNIIMSTAKGVLGVASTMTPSTVSKTNWDFTTTTTKKTGKKKAYTITENKSGTRTTNVTKGNTSISAMESAVDVINSSRIGAETDRPSNGLVNLNTCVSMKLIFKTLKGVGMSEKQKYEYNHLYGKPLGEPYRLGDLEGYTEISTIHIEGEGFNKATETEKAMLNDILTSGIILPIKQSEQF